MSPEQALMAAVLADAVDLLLHPPLHPRRHKDYYPTWRARREAALWILAASTTHIFGFGTICDALNLDVKILQDTLGKSCNLAAVLRLRPGDSIQRNATPQVRIA